MASHRSSEASKRVIDETKRLYADILAKPLDDRQLARPSFKFIQEIVKNLITETKTLRNVFNHADFETENKTWDRRRKCEFVQRLIDFAANHKQPVVGCVADKLVAGLEPNKANELLQSLAKIAQARLAGQDGPPNRPRTFTRRSPSSVSSPKQPTEAIASDSPRSSQQAATGGGARNSGVGLAANKSTPSQRNVNGNRSRTTAPRKVTQQPSTRDVSASSSRVGSSRRTSSQTNQSDEATRSRVSSVVGTNDARQLLHDNSVEPAEETREVPSRRTSGNTETGVYHNTPSKKQSASKLSLGSAPKGGPVAAGSGVKSLQDIIVSESDINKNIQQLRSNLDQLRYNLLEMSQFDVKLRTDLKAFIR